MGDSAEMILDGILDWNGEYNPYGCFSSRVPKPKKCKFCNEVVHGSMKAHYFHKHVVGKIPCPHALHSAALPACGLRALSSRR